MRYAVFVGSILSVALTTSPTRSAQPMRWKMTYWDATADAFGAGRIHTIDAGHGIVVEVHGHHLCTVNKPDLMRAPADQGGHILESVEISCAVGASTVEFGETCDTEIPDNQVDFIKIDKGEIYIACSNR